MERWRNGRKEERVNGDGRQKLKSPHKVNPELIKYYSWLAPRGAWKIAKKNWSHCSQ
jgi:hypothetical protein